MARDICLQTTETRERHKMRSLGFITILLQILLLHGIDVNPEQLHLSYGVNPSQMYVTWSTMGETTNATCVYGTNINSLNMVSFGSTTKFTDPQPQKHTQYIHRVALTQLKPNTQYYYSCGNGKFMSTANVFNSMNPDPKFSPNIVLFGDMGSVNAKSVPYLVGELQHGMVDTILHVGDFAYDFQSDGGKTGDVFMRNIEPLAASIPYMTCPGNHEFHFNFTHYKNRFTMPGDENGEKMFFSFDLGPAHIISLNTEYYYYWQFGAMQMYRQYDFLMEDLKKANENRAERPWIITIGHRPMYCSNKDRDDCTHYYTLVRSGIPIFKAYGLEELFYQNGVDIMFWAHEHSYERLWPLYNTEVYNGSKENPYKNPGAPVHIITGSAGCDEGHDYFKNTTDVPYWSAFRSDDYGYTRMKIHNASHVYLEQVSIDQGGDVIDKVWVVRDKHGPYYGKENQRPVVSLL